ncbi:MAG: hypothetical protein ACLUD1_08730 [Clostridia bacterium]
MANRFAGISPVNPLQRENVFSEFVTDGQLANKFAGILPVKPLHP